MNVNIKQDVDSIYVEFDSRGNCNLVNMSEHDKERLAKENHSDIERRRRNKMTQFINELAELIPACNSQVSSILFFCICKSIYSLRNRHSESESQIALTGSYFILARSIEARQIVHFEMGSRPRRATPRRFQQNMPLSCHPRNV